MRIDTGTQPLASSTAQPPTTPLDSSGSGVVIPFNAPASGTSSFEQVLNAARAAAPSATSQPAPMTGQTAPMTGQLATTAPPLITTSGHTIGGSTALSGLVPPLGANAPTGTAGSSGASGLPSTSGALPGISGMSGSGCCCGGVSAMATSATSAVGGATATQPAPAVALAGASSALGLPFQGKYDVTQPFGPSPFVFEPAYNGYDHFHTGIDYGLPLGTTVAAAGAGRVVAAGWDSSGFGNHVVIDHGNGVRTLYGHLERIDVTVGQQLQPGQEIGLSGSTGNSSGPHLHFSVEKDGKWVDPTPYLNATTTTTATTATVAPSLAYSALGASLPPVTPPSPGLSGTSGAMTGMTTAGVGGASASTSTAGTTNLQAMIRQVAQNTGVPAALLSGVVQAESSGDAHAVSSAGAKGLMQLTDATAASMGVTDVFDPMQNLMGGAKFLRSLLQRYHGDEQLALAAYNAGPGAVDRYGGIPPFGETQQYVKRVTQYERNYSGV